jgi:formylglycine-generating enzyme required for sulfatase activity
MIGVGPGAVALTDRRTQRSWTVELEPYVLGVVPVTQARYAEVTGESPSAARGDGLPVECVSWRGRRLGRVLRRWVERRAWSCRASVRRGSHPTFAIDDVGFRVARSVR